MLMISLQKSLEDGVYNEFKLSLYFELNLVYMYSNISFTEKQRENEFKLYDNLKSNGFFDLFFKHINPSEYDELFETLEIIKNNNMKYRTSAGFILNSLIENLPVNAETAAKIVENFNPEQYKAVVDFANYANGNRNIKTNLPLE